MIVNLGRVLALILLLHSYLGANFFDPNDKVKLEILKNLDIPVRFLNDKHLIDMYNLQKKHYSARSLAQNTENFNIMLPILNAQIAQSDLPNEFIAIVIAESRLKNEAKSSKGAAGLWQFMERTGKLHGLSVDSYVDERLDYTKSTRAAVIYLSNLKKMFNKWYLTLMAYNCGEGCLQKAIRKAKSDDISVLLDPNKKYIPKQTRQYVRKIVALSFLMADDPLLFIPENESLQSDIYDSPLAAIYLPSGEDVGRVAEVLEMPKQKIASLNNHLKKGVIPNDKNQHALYIPAEKLSDFMRKYKTKSLKSYFVLDTLKSGDTLDTLSHKHDVSRVSIAKENKLQDGKLSKTLSYVKIPIDPTKKFQVKKHIAKNGETLASVALMYNISHKEIKHLNPFMIEKLRDNQEVRIE